MWITTLLLTALSVKKVTYGNVKYYGNFICNK